MMDCPAPGNCHVHEVVASPVTPVGMMTKLAQERYPCELCNGDSDPGDRKTLFWFRQGVRCPCASTARRPKLVIFCFWFDRYGSETEQGSPNTGIFGRFMELAHAFFRVELRQHFSVYQSETCLLDGAHIAFVDPAHANPNISDRETEALVRFVNEEGGTLVVDGYTSKTKHGREFKVHINMKLKNTFFIPLGL